MKKLYRNRDFNNKGPIFNLSTNVFWWNGKNRCYNTKGNHLNYLPKEHRYMCSDARLYSEKELLKSLRRLRILRYIYRDDLYNNEIYLSRWFYKRITNKTTRCILDYKVKFNGRYMTVFNN